MTDLLEPGSMHLLKWLASQLITYFRRHKHVGARMGLSSQQAATMRSAFGITIALTIKMVN